MKPPKRHTAESIRTHLKQYILRNSTENFDITNEVAFPKFTMFWKGYIKTLKSKGEGDTKHNPKISNEDKQKIYEFLVLMHKVMVGKPFLMDETKDPPAIVPNPEYAKLLEEMPKAYNDKGNKIIANLLIKKISEITFQNF